MNNNQKLSRVECLLFDLDGTLVDTTDLIVECFHRTWERHYGYRPSRRAVIDTIGLLIDHAMHLLLAQGAKEGRLPMPPDAAAAVQQLLADYRAEYIELHDRMIRSFPGVPEMLQRLHDSGYRLGIVTSKRRTGADRSLRVFDLAPWFDTIVCGEDTTEHKPHPAPVLNALERLAAGPQQAAYIGDSTHDMIAGQRAGVLTVSALWGPFDGEALRATAPTLTAASPAELADLLGRP